MASNVTAQSVLAEISQGHLECPICSERFKQPKLLECSHSFCLECLQQLRENSPSTTKLSCPVCRQETLVREKGIDGLKSDFKSLSLLEAFETQEKRLKQQQGKQVPSQELVSKCSKHTDKDLIMYCNKCNELLCTTCIAKDHSKHPSMKLNEASDKSKQHATELLAEVRKSLKSFNIAIQEIDMSHKTLDSMFATTKKKISKKADEEIAKEVARIRGEKQKLMQEAEQIYKDRVKTMETARATNSKEMNKAEHMQSEVNQLMDQGINIVHHIEQLLQDLKEYREMRSTKVPDGLTYMDFKEGQKSLGRLVLKDEQQIEPATFARAGKVRFSSIKHFKQNNWRLKSEMKTYKNTKRQMVMFSSRDVTAFSNSDIVMLDSKSASLITVPKENYSQFTVNPQELSIEGLTEPSKLTMNKNDELIVLDDGEVKIFSRTYQLLSQFNPGNPTSCIAASDDNNIIAVGYRSKAEISLQQPDGSLIKTLPAPGIGDYLTTYKQQLIYTKYNSRKLVSVDYNGEVVFSADIHHSGRPCGVSCDKDGNIYVAVLTGPFLSLGEIHHYSPDGKYIECIIKGCNSPTGITITSAGDLVVTTDKSVQIYHHS